LFDNPVRVSSLDELAETVRRLEREHLRSQELGPQRRPRTRRRRYHPRPSHHRLQPHTSRPSLL